MKTRFTLAWVLCVASTAALAADVELPITRDSRFYGHEQETGLNGGTATRLRVRDIRCKTPELVALDFDREALADFLKKNKSKDVVGELTLFVREVQGGDKVKVEAASLDSGTDWTEGQQNQKAAEKGEATFLRAQSPDKPWTNDKDKPVASLLELIWGPQKAKVATRSNNKSVEVSKDMADKPVVLELGKEFLEHMATTKSCRGLVLFSQQAQGIADFYSREQINKEPKLVVKTK